MRNLFVQHTPAPLRRALEAVEDAFDTDLREARKALAERGSISWEKVKKDLGL